MRNSASRPADPRMMADVAAGGVGGLGRWALIGRGLGSSALWAPVIVLVVLLSTWQAGVWHTLFGFQVFTVPYPDAIVADLEANAPLLINAARVTLPAALIGYAGGMTVGFLLATILVRFAPGAISKVLPPLTATNSLPIVALAPLVALWIGGGIEMKIVVVMIMTTPIMMVYAVRGLMSVDPTALELMASYESTPTQVYRLVQVPTALPFVFTALKSAVVLALIGTIVSEVVRGFEGLGFVIMDSMASFRVARGWSALIAISALGIGWYVIVGLVERLLIPWEEASRRRA